MTPSESPLIKTFVAQSRTECESGVIQLYTEEEKEYTCTLNIFFLLTHWGKCISHGAF